MNILEKVEQKITTSKELIIDSVVDKLAQVELDKRIKLIGEVVARLENLEKEHKKIDRADNITYVMGAKQESFTENRYKDIQKSKEKITNLTNTLNKALEDNTLDSYNKLQEVYNKSNSNAGGNQNKGSGEVKSEAQSSTD